MSRTQITVAPPGGGDPNIVLDEVFAKYLTFKANRSAATGKAYRNDYAALSNVIATILDVTTKELVASDLQDAAVLAEAFNTHFETRPASSRRRAWSTWNGFCEFMALQGHLPANPMRLMDSPSHAASTAPPKAIEGADVYRLLTQLAMPDEDDKKGPSNWRERDLALILSGLLLGLRTAEMIDLKIGHFTARHDEPGAMAVTVKGKGGKYRTVTAEPELTEILETYLRSRVKRFPDTIPDGRKRNRNPWKRFDPDQPLFVGGDGERITRGTIQYRVKRAYARAGIIPSPGASTHRLRHTFAIQLAESGVPVHVLMNLLGHASMASTQKYLEASGAATREASRSNPLYTAIPLQS